jgi:hypothetical protein
MSGAKQMLSLTRFIQFSGKVTGEPFQVMMNPSGYTRNKMVQLSKQEARLDVINPETLVLEELVLDGTGVVGAGAGAPLSVDQQLAKLRSVLFYMADIDKVRSPLIQLVWGSLYFLGRVQRMEVKYTMFKPNGLPLRARVKLYFIEFDKDYKQAAPQAQDKAMTRQIQVTAGATLPLLCFQAYQDPGMAQAVARANDLTTFRNVPAGQKLAFPPK